MGDGIDGQSSTDGKRILPQELHQPLPLKKKKKKKVLGIDINGLTK